ncbi:V-type ATP synthase subunit E [Shimia thalassica]|uniref:V-type ATP synthase subunit E n=1 Tax=Shimia thalassica TaxID=1715693 RepID=A0A0P1IPQ2_9RHOB|nr:hypothetical protein [Shimia thalassica]CUK11564.1 V-type ATP synthase subunit E [Shimia thalassica]
MTKQGIVSHGVDELIDKLRNDGIAAGRQEAERLQAEAEAEAARIVAEAKKEATGYLRKAHTDADNYVKAGEEALNTAMRDAVLSMKSELTRRFAADVQRLVTQEMADPELMRQLILEVVGTTARQADLEGKIDVILPEKAATQEDIKKNADDIQHGKLTKYVLGLTAEMLREDVTLHVADDLKEGIRMRSDGEGVVLDLSDAAVGSVLLEHLQPRFQAVLDGVIR